MNPFDQIAKSLYQKKPWDEKFQQPLLTFGLKETQNTWKTLLSLVDPVDFPALYPEFFPTFLDLLGKSYDPETALNNFSRAAEKIPDKNHLYTLLTEAPEFLQALIILFSGSQVLTDILLQDPSHFDWLHHPETLNKSKSRDILMRDFYEMAGTADLSSQTPSLLRRFKKRESVRIGLRDLMRKAECKETVKDLADLADVCLQVAYEYADGACKTKYGLPVYQDPRGKEQEAEFAVLGMGKLGGLELNYSSDIDLIYIYSSNKGETRAGTGTPESITSISAHEYFSKVAQILTRTIHEITPEGNVFRVDLDLRPEGRSGEIVNSLAACEIYYASWGRPWERQALLKARVSAGSEALGKEFFSMLEPFIHPRTSDFSAIDEIKAMKQKINQSLRPKKTEKRHIKLGFGGIREIEFIVQSYQLLFGGKDRSLRVANTLDLLDRLLERDYIHKEDFQSLKEAYIFLRNLENRVQISFGLQTHLLPEEESKLAVLSRKMGFAGETTSALTARLMEEYDRHTHFVGNYFANLFVAEEEKQAAQQVSEGKHLPGGTSAVSFSPEIFEEFGFPEPDRAFRFLQSLRAGQQFYHPTEKSLRNFNAVLPQILKQASKAPKPNSAVENLVKFVEAGKARDTFLDLFRSNEKFLELLLLLFGGSDLLSEILIKRPELVDVLMDTESIYRYKPPAKIQADLQLILLAHPGLEEKKIALRRFKQGEELRVGVRYIIGEADLRGTLTDLSNLADIFLETVTQIAHEELNRNRNDAAPLDDFAILAMGKLGGRELNFGSDLDVVFVFDEPENGPQGMTTGEAAAHYAGVSQMIYQLTSEMTPAGYAYKVDTDLRPEGSGGVLAHSLKGYEDYFNSRARIWEKQAMTRVRFVAGKKKLGERFLQTAQAFTYAHKLEYGSLIEISRLRERMEKELANERKKGKNVKLGYGGLADIEFTAQVLQLMHGTRNPRVRATNTLDAIKAFSDLALIDQTAAERLQENYLFLRNLECALRLINRQSSNHLPAKDEPLAEIGKLLKYSGDSPSGIAGKLKADYEKTTREVRAFYNKTLDMLLRTSL